MHEARVSDIKWITKSFNDLTSSELYSLLQLRSEVFVVEQKCIFQDIDGMDLASHHVLGYDGKTLTCCTRIFDINLNYEGYQSIGRVATSHKYRRIGLGKKLMEVSISECQRLYGLGAIKIGAQQYLQSFYSSFKFEISGDGYIEDDIPHIPMIRRPE